MHIPIRNGFTLIEMLVALSVFSIAALALLRLDSFAVATATELSARGGAQLVAENRAVEVATDPNPPVRGATTLGVSNGGRSYTVNQNVTPTPDQRLVRVDIAVIESGGTGRAALTLIRRVQ